MRKSQDRFRIDVLLRRKINRNVDNLWSSW